MSKKGVLSGVRVLRTFLLGAAVVALSQLAGCASFYVDTALKDVKSEQIAKAENPQPTQLLFEFQSKGATNARATDMLKKRVTELVQASGLFSQVTEGPAPNGSLLNIVVNNVPLTDDAAAKGFVTGLTFGLAGSAVTDGYICTLDYLPGEGGAKTSKTVRHAIHTTLGAKDAPAGAVKSASVDEAVQTMLRQIVNNALNDLSRDPAFKQAVAAK